MEPAHYTDPLEDALSHGSQRLAQLASLLGATAQVVWQRRALADARRSARTDRRALRVITDQERVLHEQARLAWAPALDPQWLAHADLIEVARAWSRAVASADADPSAKTARRRCEDKLRKLHPHAMAYYDRRRADGATPLEAMREATPLFAYAPSPRTGDPAPARQALESTIGAESNRANNPSTGDLRHDRGASGSDPADVQGQRIIDQLQVRARADGRPSLSSEELALTLAAVTNLPHNVIDRLAQQAGRDAHHTDGEGAATAAALVPAADPRTAADLTVSATSGEYATSAAVTPRDSGVADTARGHHPDQSAVQLAAQSFPHTAAEAIQAAASTGETANPSQVRSPAPHKAKRQSRSL